MGQFCSCCDESSAISKSGDYPLNHLDHNLSPTAPGPVNGHKKSKSELQQSLLSDTHYISEQSQIQSKHHDNNSVSSVHPQLTKFEEARLHNHVKLLSARLNDLETEIQDSELECKIGAEEQDKQVENLSRHNSIIQTNSNGKGLINDNNNNHINNNNLHNGIADIHPDDLLDISLHSLSPSLSAELSPVLGPTDKLDNLDDNLNPDETLSKDELEKIMQSED